VISHFVTRAPIPDRVLRFGIRRLLHRRLGELARPTEAAEQAELMAWIRETRQSPVALATDDANRQHYEVPAAFFETVLGPRLKYSSGFWEPGADLARAEEAMLELYAERAGLEDGMRVLDLGCGWGSLSLWIAERFPDCRITALSNSAPQRRFIEARARERGFDRLEVITANMAEHRLEGTFDRVFTVEMFEHMRNWEDLLANIAGVLAPGGRLFVHIFTHGRHGYAFKDGGWMTEEFFTGGQMPADSQMLYFQKDLLVTGHWRVDGTHYAKTAEAWLDNMDHHRHELAPVLAETYGDRAAEMTRAWRIFFLACAELWAFRNGREWFVSHYALEPR